MLNWSKARFVVLVLLFGVLTHIVYTRDSAGAPHDRPQV